MNLSDYVDITRETPPHRILWTGAGITLPFKSSTNWLYEQFGPMPNQYLFYSSVYACSTKAWNDDTKDYDEVELITSDGEEFTKLYQPLVDKAMGLFPERDVRPRRGLYDVTDEWERWSLEWFVGKYDTVHQPCVMIAFKDEMLAIQCKLALS
jgi:hypothetical protein